MFKDLSLRQKEILDFLREYSSEKGYPASIRDIGSFFSIDPSTVAQHIDALERKGFIIREKNKSRTITLVEHFENYDFTRAKKASPGSRIIGNNRKLFIQSMVNRLLFDYLRKYEPSKRLSIPIPVESILEKLFEFSTEKSILEGDIRALLFLKERKIILNALDSVQRRRFSLGHETGHIVLHQHTKLKNKEVVTSRGYDDTPIEQEANYFSSNLLIPLEKLKELIQSENIPYNKEARLIDLVSVKFNTSREVASYQLRYSIFA